MRTADWIPGVYFLDVEAPQLDSERYYYNAQHVLVVSDLNVTLKVSPDEAVVWATDLTSGDPVPDLELTFMEILRWPVG